MNLFLSQRLSFFLEQNHRTVRVICDSEGFVVNVYVQSVLHRGWEPWHHWICFVPTCQVTWNSLIFLLINCKMGTCLTFQRCLADRSLFWKSHYWNRTFPLVSYAAFCQAAMFVGSLKGTACFLSLSAALGGEEIKVSLSKGKLK